MAHDTLLVDDDGKREALIANPRHHVLRLDEVRPCEMVLVGNALGCLSVVVGGREEHYVGQLLFPLGKDGHLRTTRATARVPEVDHHDAPSDAIVRPCTPVHVLF